MNAELVVSVDELIKLQTESVEKYMSTLTIEDPALRMHLKMHLLLCASDLVTAAISKADFKKVAS